MKKVLLVILVFYSFNGFAQRRETTNTKKPIGWFGLHGGVNAPISSFNEDKLEAEAGWAQVGWMAKADLGIILYENIGLVITPIVFQNPISEKAISNTIVASGYTFEEIEFEAWKFKGVFLGPEFRIPSTRSPFFIKAQLGYLNCKSPYFRYLVGVPGYSVSIQQESESANAFATNIGCGLKFNLNDIVLLTMAIDYTSVKPEFKDVLLTLNNNGKYEYQTITFKQHVTSIFPTLGFTWKL